MAPIDVDIAWFDSAPRSKSQSSSCSKEFGTSTRSLDSDSIGRLLHELGVEGDDVMKEKLAQSRSRWRQSNQSLNDRRLRRGSRSRSRSGDDEDYYHCDEHDTGLSYMARNLPHHTPSDLLDEEGRRRIQAEEERTRMHQARKVPDQDQEWDNSSASDGDIYRDCHYRIGSTAYGYLINRCPDHPLTTTPPKCHSHSHSHSSSHHRASMTIADTAASLRQIDRLITPGMILVAMLMLLLAAIAIVEAVDMVVKWMYVATAEEEAATATVPTRISSIKRLLLPSGNVLVPQNDTEEKSIVEINNIIEGNSEKPRSTTNDNQDNDNIDEMIL